MTCSAAGGGHWFVAKIRVLRSRILFNHLSQHMPWGRGSSMTIQTPTHGERFFLINPIHLFYVPVADFAGNAFSNVALVRKINEVRKFMNANPFNRSSFSKVLFQFL